MRYNSGYDERKNKNIEDQLNIKLFERNTRNIIVRNETLPLIEQASKIVQLINEIKCGERVKECVIGVTSTVEQSLICKVVSELSSSVDFISIVDINDTYADSRYDENINYILYIIYYILYIIYYILLFLMNLTNRN